MSNRADLEHRLRSAAGPDPDTEGALGDVMARIRRRTRRSRIVLVSSAALIVGLVTAWVIQDRTARESPVLVGEPPSTGIPGGPEQVRLRELWSALDVGMALGAPSNGRLLMATEDAVLAAEGFGTGKVEPSGRITALDRHSGSTRWTTELDGPAFLQGSAGGVAVANTQNDRIVGLNPDDGSVIWEISLAELGLEGYGAVTSAVTQPVSAIGTSASSEGDVRPPVILGVETATGALVWTRALVEGTDLMWGVPPVADGETVFTSTLSHPGSAAENVAHLIELDDGSVRWTVGMGGGQGFSEHAAVIDGESVHLPAHPAVVSVDRTDGTRRWERPGRSAVVVGARLWTIEGGTIAFSNPATGDLIGQIDAPVEQPQRLLPLGGDAIAVISYSGVGVVSTDGRRDLRHAWPSELIDVPVLDGNLLIIAAGDGSVTAYAIELIDAPPSTVMPSDARCPPIPDDAPTVDNYAVTAIPDGFAPDGPVEQTSTGDVDADGESRSTLRLTHADGRWIDVVAFGSYDPGALIAEAQQGYPAEEVTFPRCIDTTQGASLTEQRAELSTSDVGIVLGAQEWEYGGFLVTAGPDIAVDEVIRVAAAVRLR